MKTLTLILTDKEADVVIAGIHSVIIGNQITMSLADSMDKGCGRAECPAHGPIVQNLQAMKETHELATSVLRKCGVTFDSPEETPKSAEFRVQ